MSLTIFQIIVLPLFKVLASYILAFYDVADKDTSEVESTQTSLLRRLQAQTLPDEAPPVGKIGKTTIWGNKD